MADFSPGSTLRELVDQRAGANRDNRFLISAETRTDITFGQLQRHARVIENYLNQIGIPRGATAAFMLDNGCWTAVLMLGIMYAGRVVLPLNVVAGSDQLEFIIHHSDLKVIFCSSHYRDEFSDLLGRINPSVRLIECSENDGPAAINAYRPEAINRNNTIDGNSTALMIYTSGTTGRPKGVLLSHKNIIAGGRNTVQAHRLTACDRGLCILPLYHINAEMVSIMSPLVSGGSVVISRRLSITHFWNWIVDHHCTWFSAVPTIFAYLIERRQSGSQPSPDKGQLRKQLRFARSASAALPPATHETFESLFSVPIIETMGISECAGQILSNPIDRRQCKVGSPGIPFGNEIRIVDINQNELGAGRQGEIAVRGDNVMQGYYKNPGESGKALDKAGWFYTGDLGYKDKDGFVFVTGRLKELIIKGGENIAPREIDDVLYRHPSVLEAAAFGVSDKIYGQEVMAAVSLKPNMTCDESTLLGHCARLLGTVKSPRQICILDDLPKGPSGKIQRLKLQTLLEKRGSHNL